MFVLCVSEVADIPQIASIVCQKRTSMFALNRTTATCSSGKAVGG
jgi:hypothetical protein